MTISRAILCFSVMTIVPVFAGSAAQAYDNYDNRGLVPNRTMSLSFDGFCDGMTFLINQSNGTVTGRATGCSQHPVRGLPGAVSGGLYAGQGVVVGISPYGYGGFLYVISNAPRKWEVYDLGTGASVNSGTWSPGAPPATTGARALKSFDGK